MNKLTTVKGISKKIVIKQRFQRVEVQGLWNIYTRIQGDELLYHFNIFQKF